MVVGGGDMGSEIDNSEFSAADFEQFQQRLDDNLKHFRQLLNQPGFGEGPISFGAELELYIIDHLANTMPINRELATALDDPRLSLELNRFNLEYNFTPVIDSATPFSQLRQQMDQALLSLHRKADQLNARVLPIGILPTLQVSNMGLSAITESARYSALAQQLRQQRGEDFHININGIDSLKMHWQDITLEGANTSFQFHYRVKPQQFADTYNAAQLITPLMVGLGANSPLFLGRRLWQETRVALFKQSIDHRPPNQSSRYLPSRVYFGNGWIRNDIFELFAEGVSLFDPLLPVIDNDPGNTNRKGKGPALEELRLHQGSIWIWNRPIYDPADNGHLRIELRTLPAGPSTLDMVALAAFSIGLIEGLRPQIPELLPCLPFKYCEKNFYRAAREGMGTKLIWPGSNFEGLQEINLATLAKQLLPVARTGLQSLGIDNQEIDELLEVVEATAEKRRNGAQWQLDTYQQLLDGQNPSQALSELVEHYYERYRSGQPVHQWSIP